MAGDLVEPSKAKAAGIVSCILAACALGDLVCGFIWVSYGGPDASGVWSGFAMAITAVLGIVVWLKHNKTVMVFYLVMNIIVLILALVQIIIALIGWLIWHIIRKIVEKDCHMVGDRCHCSGDKDVPIKIDNCDAIYTIESCFCAIVILTSFAFILLLAGSIIGCMATCCAKNQTQTEVVVVQQPGVVVHTQAAPPPAYGNQGPVFGNQGQQQAFPMTEKQ